MMKVLSLQKTSLLDCDLRGFKPYKDLTELV